MSAWVVIAFMLVLHSHIVSGEFGDKLNANATDTSTSSINSSSQYVDDSPEEIATTTTSTTTTAPMITPEDGIIIEKAILAHEIHPEASFNLLDPPDTAKLSIHTYTSTDDEVSGSSGTSGFDISQLNTLENEVKSISEDPISSTSFIVEPAGKDDIDVEVDKSVQNIETITKSPFSSSRRNRIGFNRSRSGKQKTYSSTYRTSNFVRKPETKMSDNGSNNIINEGAYSSSSNFGETHEGTSYQTSNNEPVFQETSDRESLNLQQMEVQNVQEYSAKIQNVHDAGQEAFHQISTPDPVELPDTDISYPLRKSNSQFDEGEYSPSSNIMTGDSFERGFEEVSAVEAANVYQKVKSAQEYSSKIQSLQKSVSGDIQPSTQEPAERPGTVRSHHPQETNRLSDGETYIHFPNVGSTHEGSIYQPLNPEPSYQEVSAVEPINLHPQEVQDVHDYSLKIEALQNAVREALQPSISDTNDGSDAASSYSYPSAMSNDEGANTSSSNADVNQEIMRYQSSNSQPESQGIPGEESSSLYHKVQKALEYSSKMKSPDIEGNEIIQVPKPIQDKSRYNGHSYLPPAHSNTQLPSVSSPDTPAVNNAISPKGNKQSPAYSQFPIFYPNQINNHVQNGWKVLPNRAKFLSKIKKFPSFSPQQSISQDKSRFSEYNAYFPPASLKVPSNHLSYSASRAYPSPMNTKPYSGRHSPSNVYSGPTAVPVVLRNGYLSDTHDVIIARIAHLHALRNAYEVASRWKKTKPQHWS